MYFHFDIGLNIVRSTVLKNEDFGIENGQQVESYAFLFLPLDNKKLIASFGFIGKIKRNHV